MLAGSFKDFSFDEIITLTGRHTGKLVIGGLTDTHNSRPTKTCELYLDRMTLHALYVNGEAIRDQAAAFDEIVTLLTIKTGRFEFFHEPEEIIESLLDIDLNRVILDAAVVLDEFKASLQTLMLTDSIFDTTIKKTPTNPATPSANAASNSSNG